MAYENEMIKHTVVAGEDLRSYQFHAISLEDGARAVSGIGGVQASGILLNKPESGQHAELGVIGVIKFAAGAAVTKGARVAVSSGGWFAVAGSGDMGVGTAIKAVSSGGIGTALFSFATPVYAFSSSFVE